MLLQVSSSPQFLYLEHSEKDSVSMEFGQEGFSSSWNDSKSVLKMLGIAINGTLETSCS